MRKTGTSFNGIRRNRHPVSLNLVIHNNENENITAEHGTSSEELAVDAEVMVKAIISANPQVNKVSRSIATRTAIGLYYADQRFLRTASVCCLVIGALLTIIEIYFSCQGVLGLIAFCIFVTTIAILTNQVLETGFNLRPFLFNRVTKAYETANELAKNIMCKTNDLEHASLANNERRFAELATEIANNTRTLNKQINRFGEVLKCVDCMDLTSEEEDTLISRVLDMKKLEKEVRKVKARVCAAYSKLTIDGKTILKQEQIKAMATELSNTNIEIPELPSD